MHLFQAFVVILFMIATWTFPTLLDEFGALFHISVVVDSLIVVFIFCPYVIVIIIIIIILIITLRLKKCVYL
jgi:hypothetical protein